MASADICYKPTVFTIFSFSFINMSRRRDRASPPMGLGINGHLEDHSPHLGISSRLRTKAHDEDCSCTTCFTQTRLDPSITSPGHRKASSEHTHDDLGPPASSIDPPTQRATVNGSILYLKKDKRRQLKGERPYRSDQYPDGLDHGHLDEDESYRSPNLSYNPSQEASATPALERTYPFVLGLQDEEYYDEYGRHTGANSRDSRWHRSQRERRYEDESDDSDTGYFGPGKETVRPGPTPKPPKPPPRHEPYASR